MASVQKTLVRYGVACLVGLAFASLARKYIGQIAEIPQGVEEDQSLKGAALHSGDLIWVRPLRTQDPFGSARWLVVRRASGLTVESRSDSLEKATKSGTVEIMGMTDTVVFSKQERKWFQKI